MLAMTVENKREDILKHETLFYAHNRPNWIVGKVPDLSDYRKLSVDNMDEAMKLAQIGQQTLSKIIPSIHGKPNRLYFTQSLVAGAAVLSRSMADKWGLDFEKYRSVLFVTPSRTGKSYVNAQVVIARAGANGDEVQIGGATRDKAAIIQGKVVEMLPFAMRDIQNGLIITDNNGEEDQLKKIKRLATQVSKESLKWTNGGSINLFSTNESQKNAQVAAAGAIGIGGDFCIDGENKVLTRRGWIKLSDLPDGEAIAQYTKDGKIEFVIPSRVIRKYYKGRGYNVRFTGGNKDIFMIPEHRQPLVNKSGETVVREIRKTNFNGYWSVIMAGEGTGPDELLPIDRIVIACQADGCILKTTEKGNYFQLKVKKERKAQRLEMLFDKAGMNVKIHQDKRGYFVCHFYMPHNCNKSLPDWFGWEFGVNKARAILKELTEWDGYVYPNETLNYSSKDRRNVEWVQAVAAQAGYRSRVSVQHDNRSESYSDMYRIYMKDTPTRTCDHAKKEDVGWDGMVYCVTVPSGMFLIKSGNLTNVTGNCVMDEIQMMSPIGFRTASRFMVESPDTKRFCVGNPMINGHFRELYDDPSTFVVHANDVTTIIEGRMTRRGFELTGMPTYSPEYRYFIETEFPDTKSGSRFFPNLPEIWDAAKLPTPVDKYYFIGLDSAYQGVDAVTLTLMSMNRGGGKVWFVIEKQINLKERFSTWTDTTTLEICVDILKLWEQYKVVAGAMDIGFGIHIYEKLKDLAPNLPIEPINYSSRPTEWRIANDYNAQFAANKRAELHLDMRDLCSSNMMYVENSCYEEIMRQMQEVGQSPVKQKIQIEAKKDIKARLGRSPDNLDSACLAVHAMILSGVLESTADPASSLMEVF